ncbi:IPIL1 protein, partial [Pycnonotus jocosus]|nr:IPIL1 protein [Pycnonotus jocosus]
INSLMNNFTFYFRRVLADSFYPVLKTGIGVGSAFEGWSPREQDVECICEREEQGSNTLCFLHHTEEELSNQDPSLLDTLCTDSYLDVQKTARWFCQLVRAIWPGVPQAHNWHLVMLPSRRCCQFKVSNGRESFRIEMLCGVLLANTDVFVSSQPRHCYASTPIWPETYAVAELKFLNYVAWRAPHDSLHLKCLQFFTRLQLGLGFSTYITKTIVMHLLNCLPVSAWRRKHFVRRLLDISENLRKCIEMRCLNQLIVGNQRLPEGIVLPPHVLKSSKYNLFHDLVRDPAAHAQAMSQYEDL